MTHATPNFKSVLAVGQALDLRLPDSGVVEVAYIHACTSSDPWLFNHVSEVVA